MRNRIWYSIEELRVAVAEMMATLNDKTKLRFGRSRRQLFEEIDRALLKESPPEPYVRAQVPALMEAPGVPTGITADML